MNEEKNLSCISFKKISEKRLRLNFSMFYKLLKIIKKKLKMRGKKIN